MAKKNQAMTYASQRLNMVEQNYLTTEYKALAIIYVVKKYKHYLLRNRFQFVVDHDMLLRLVNQLIITNQIVR